MDNGNISIVSSPKNNDFSTDIQKVKDKLAELKEKRRVLREEWSLYASNKDFTENSDTTFTQEAIDMLDRQILRLEQELGLAGVERPKKLQVTYCDFRTQEIKEIILTPNRFDANAAEGRVWFNSPLGIILSTKDVDTTSEVLAPVGKYKIQILKKQWLT